MRGERGNDYDNARWYDSSIMVFSSPDTLIPDPINPLDWNRYLYARGNPIRNNDPSGHAVALPGNAGCGEDSACRNDARQEYLFSLVAQGTGNKDGLWSTQDWQYYYANEDGLWSGNTPWIIPEEQGWNTFAAHVDRLSQHYRNNRREQFVRDFGLLFAGIRYDTSWQDAVWEVRGGHTLRFLNEGTQGLPPEYLDTVNAVTHPENNQSHHYAGLFVLGFFTDAPTGIAVNIFRDTIDPGLPPRIAYNPGDISLGNVAARQGSWLRRAWARDSSNGNPIMDLAGLIAALAR